MGLLINRAMALCNASGTGAVTPGAGKAPYRTWAAAGAQVGYWYDYLIEQGSDWEIGVGLYNGTTISRPGPGVDPWFESSTGSLLSVTASATIACVANRYTMSAPAPFMPPVSNQFAGSLNPGGVLTITDDPAVGCVINTGAYVGGDNLRGPYMAAPATPWTLIARIQFYMPPTANPQGGLFLYDDISGRIQNFIISNRANPCVGVYNYNTPTSFNGFQFNNGDGWSPVEPFFAMKDDGTNVSVGFVPDGKNIVWVGSFGRTTFLTNGPRKVGFLGVPAGGWGGAQLTLTCSYWKFS
jgi:hypothetical protein